MRTKTMSDENTNTNEEVNASDVVNETQEVKNIEMAVNEEKAQEDSKFFLDVTEPPPEEANNNASFEKVNNTESISDEADRLGNTGHSRSDSDSIGNTEPPPEEADNEANFEKLPENNDPNIDTITVQSVCKTYRGRQVVNHVSLNIKKGEIVGLLGPNGAGKTTTFYMVVGLVKPDEGRVLYNNQDITKKAMYQRARMGIGYLPQEASVFRKLTVRENIWLILENINISERERKERLDMLLTDLDIGRISESLGYALSGGERRRVEIARALAAEPSFILLDEPFAGVDPIAVADIQSIVLKLQKKGLGLLITDHNVSETLAIVDRAYILSLGKILVSGSAQFVAENETARKFYLGDRFKLDQIDKKG